MKTTYLDNNATTQIDPQVATAIWECMQNENYKNPASQHQLGRKAKARLELAKEQIAQVLGIHLSGSKQDQIIFTSGGTESNNLALQGITTFRPGKIILSQVEHPSLLKTARKLQQEGRIIEWIPVDRSGTLDLDFLKQQLTGDISLVCVMLANHETGIIHPLEKIATLCQAAGVPLFSDTIQAMGKIDLQFDQSEITAFSLSAHKFHGPTGIGMLAMKADLPITPILTGGQQQLGLRPGTESLPLVVGLEQACLLWKQEKKERTEYLLSLRKLFESHLQADLPHLVIQGNSCNRLPQTSNLSFPGLDRQALMVAFDLAGIACSTGSACASGSSEPSPVLTAMQVPQEQITSSLRFSFSKFNQPEEIVESARRIIKIVKELQN